MISPAREHERLSLDLAWGGWYGLDELTLVVVDLLSLKSSRLLLLLLPLVGLVAYLGFSLLAGGLLLETLETLGVVAVIGAAVGATMLVDERKSRAEHREMFTLLLETLDASEIPRESLPNDVQLCRQRPSGRRRPLQFRGADEPVWSTFVRSGGVLDFLVGELPGSGGEHPQKRPARIESNQQLCPLPRQLPSVPTFVLSLTLYIELSLAGAATRYVDLAPALSLRRTPAQPHDERNHHNEKGRTAGDCE